MNSRSQALSPRVGTLPQAVGDSVVRVSPTLTPSVPGCRPTPAGEAELPQAGNPKTKPYSAPAFHREETPGLGAAQRAAAIWVGAEGRAATWAASGRDDNPTPTPIFPFPACSLGLLQEGGSSGSLRPEPSPRRAGATGVSRSAGDLATAPRAEMGAR